MLAIAICALLAGTQLVPMDTARVTRIVNYTSVVHRGHFLDGRAFELALESKPYDAHARELREFFGGEVTTATTTVKRLSLTIAGQPVSVPNAAVSDLYDIRLPNGVALYEVGDDAVIRLRGGDGAGSFEARLLVRGLRVIRREGELVGEPVRPRIWQ